MDPFPHSAPHSPQAYAAAVPPGPGRLLKAGAAVLIAGALLLLAGAIGAFYFWKATERQVSPAAQPASERGCWLRVRERHSLGTLPAGSIKRSLSRSLGRSLRFFHAFQKNNPTQPHNHYLHWFFGWSLLEAHFLNEHETYL